MTALSGRPFVSLCVTQFLGAFNDNLFKNSLLVLVAFNPQAFGAHHINGGLLGAIAAGLFILPFFLFSATAGELSDTRDKAQMSRTVKTAEILLMLTAALGFVLYSLPLLLLALFGTGMQSAFFGPVKYAIIPQYVEKDALVAANGWIETTTFLAVLLGTIAGGLLAVSGDDAVYYCAGVVIGVALAGRICAAFMPDAPSARVSRAVLNPFRALPHVIRQARAQTQAFAAIPYISWFWFLGATYLAQMPFYVRDIAGGDGGAVTMCLAAFSLGIAGGSLVCEKLTKGSVSFKAAPLAAAVMAAGAVGLYTAGALITPAEPGVFLPARAFFTDMPRALMLISFAVIAAAGGVYIVPLYAMMQRYSREDSRSGVIAANNIINAAAMTLSALAAAVLTAIGIGIDILFLIAGLGNIVVAVVAMRRNRVSKEI